MRVAYVEMPNGFGGSLTAILDTVAYLPADVEPVLVLSYDPSPFCSPPQRLRCETLSLPPADPERERRRGVLHNFVRFSHRWVKALVPLLRRLRPDVIHANNMCALNVAVGIAGRRLGIPVVCHQRDLEFSGWPNRLVLKSGLYRHHISVSQAATDSLIRLGLPARRCSTVFDAIPPPPPRETASEDHRPPTVAMYSMLMPWKGQEIFLRAIERVARRGHVPFRAIIGGSEPFGSTSYLDELKQLAVELGIAAQVEFTGFTRNIHAKLYETDLLVLASVDPEPGGHIVQEAMMCGVPAITTDDGGPAQYARESEGALIVPRRDVEALADAIERLLLDPEQRTQLAARAQAYAPGF